MLKEALELVLNKGAEIEKRNAPKNLDFLETHKQQFVYVNGEITPFEKPPLDRGHFVDSVDDLIAAAGRWKDNPVIWVSTEAVVLIIDDDTRHDKVILRLTYSDTFKTIMGLAKDKALEQAELIRLLRVNLRKARGLNDLLTTIRKIKFRTMSEGVAHVQHGSESLGRQIENEVAGITGDIPELVTVPTNVYSNPGEEDQIFEPGLDLEIDAAKSRFYLRPIPDDVERTISLALKSIQTRIATAIPEVPVFYGRP